MNDTSVHAFFERRYKEILQSRLGRNSKRQQLEVLHRDICTVYQDKPCKRPYALVQEIELQIC